MNCRAVSWVDAASGLPVAPLAQTLKNGKMALFGSQIHMDALTVDVTRVKALGIGKKLVHLIDR